MPARGRHLAVYLEVAPKKAFACAVEWPGWCRSAKTGELALEALGAYAPRFAVVAGEAGLTFPASAGESFDVVEEVTGSTSTEFGVPGALAAVDRRPLTEAEAERQAALVEASWRVLDRVTAGAPTELRKGPRGGGRDRDKMVAHVLGAEASYARQLGVKHKEPAIDDRAAIDALRSEILAALRAARSPEPPTAKGWTPRYAARRMAWHVLDHAWEMEDRSNT